jgi:hypothetical protein
LQAGEGLILDIVYQQREILYVVEVEDSLYRDNLTISLKSIWKSEIEIYNRLLSSGQ